MQNMQFRSSTGRAVPCRVWSNGRWVSSDYSPIACQPQSWCCVPSSRECRDARPSCRADTSSCGARADRRVSVVSAKSRALYRTACVDAIQPSICAGDPSKRPPDKYHRRRRHLQAIWYSQFVSPPAIAHHSQKPTNLWKSRIYVHSSAGRPLGKLAWKRNPTARK